MEDTWTDLSMYMYMCMQKNKCSSSLKILNFLDCHNLYMYMQYMHTVHVQHISDKKIIHTTNLKHFKNNCFAIEYVCNSTHFITCTQMYN